MSKGKGGRKKEEEMKNDDILSPALAQNCGRDVTHLANFEEKVHKPQSKSYDKIGAKMQKKFTHIF